MRVYLDQEYERRVKAAVAENRAAGWRTVAEYVVTLPDDAVLFTDVTVTGKAQDYTAADSKRRLLGTVKPRSL